MALQRRNILLWCVVSLGLSLDSDAFDIKPHHAVQSTRYSTVTTSSIPTSSTIATAHAQRITVACSSKNDDWAVNSNINYNAGVLRKTETRSSELPWLTIAILFIMGKLLPVPGSDVSLGRSLIAQQFESPGISSVVFKLVTWYSASISSWYMDLLARCPLLTKTVTASLIAVVGDTVAQYFETRKERSSSTNDKDTGDKVVVAKSSVAWPFSLMKNYDRRRGLSCLGESMLVSGPLLHFAYNLMEDLVPTTNGGRSAILAAMTHALVDNFVLDTIFLATMFVTTGIAEGYVREIIPQFRKDFFPTLRMGWVAGIGMLPVQFLLFRFFPLSLRVLGVNIIDIFWGAYVSYMVHKRRRQHKSSHAKR